MAIEQPGRLEQEEAAEVAEDGFVVEPAPGRMGRKERCGEPQCPVLCPVEPNDRQPVVAQIPRKLVVEGCPSGSVSK